MSIAATTIGDIFSVSATSSLFRVYVLAARNNIDFNLAAIPQECELELDSTEFDPVTMQALFDLGFDQAKSGYDWMTAPPFLDVDEMFE